MKQKIQLYFALIVLTISCSDLEEKPVGLLEPTTFFKTVDDLQAAVNGSYAYMASEKYWGRKLTLSLLVRGDMCDIGDLSTAQRRQDVNNFEMTDDNGMVAEFWPQSYAIIGAANQAIAGADLIDANQDEINAVVAEAYFFRAFAYYHLVRLFGDIPYIDIAVSDVSTVDKISKTPEEEVYLNIISDLEFAKENLPNVTSSRSKPSKATAAAYLASVYLTLNDYQNSYAQAKYVIENEGMFNLGLESDFQDLFDANKGGILIEPLFTIDFIGQQNDGLLGMDYLAPVTGIRSDETGRSSGGGWTIAVPSLKVFDGWDGRDYRKAVSFDTIGVFNGEVHPYTDFEDFSGSGVNRPHIAKYYRFPGISGSNGRASSHNYITMRYAEVLLIAAETSTDIVEATGYVNRIRERARNRAGFISKFPENVVPGLSQSDLKDLVIEERRVELAFEFKRWYDIKRLQVGDEVFAPDALEPHPNFDTSRDYLFPLPADELARNPNLQPNNPGY
jgi:hypothetical protein